MTALFQDMHALMLRASTISLNANLLVVLGANEGIRKQLVATTTEGDHTMLSVFF